MKPEQTGYPLELHLPDGRRAEYVPESRPARYTLNGEPTAIDVTIPDDLAAAGWIWSGSFLYQPWPEREGEGRGPGVAISTGAYGPPGYPSNRQTCIEAAYELERLRSEHTALRAIKPPKKAKARKAARIGAIPELELIAEQMELAL